MKFTFYKINGCKPCNAFYENAWDDLINDGELDYEFSIYEFGNIDGKYVVPDRSFVDVAPYFVIELDNGKLIRLQPINREYNTVKQILKQIQDNIKRISVGGNLKSNYGVANHIITQQSDQNIQTTPIEVHSNKKSSNTSSNSTSSKNTKQSNKLPISTPSSSNIPDKSHQYNKSNLYNSYNSSEQYNQPNFSQPITSSNINFSQLVLPTNTKGPKVTYVKNR